MGSLITGTPYSDGSCDTYRKYRSGHLDTLSQTTCTIHMHEHTHTHTHTHTQTHTQFYHSVEITCVMMKDDIVAVLL